MALVAACGRGTVAPEAPTTAAPVTADVPSGLEKFYAQTADWGACDGFDTDGVVLGSAVECARISAPLDYDDPGGDTVELAISRMPASGQRIGALLINPGGPGAPGLSMAGQGYGTELEERFDVIGFDPRGVGASTPAVHCLTAGETDERRADNDVDRSPAGIEASEQRNRDYAEKCAQRSGTDLLAHVGTREVVQDMDIIRAAAGSDPGESMNYLGYSYGTRLGAEYAERFPDRVRTMVLDGAVNPDADPIEEIVAQAAGFQGAFDDYADDCVAGSSCPLGADPDRAVAEFRALVDPLIDRPAPTDDPRGLSYTDAMTGVQQALYSPGLWRLLTVGLRELRNGHGDTLLDLADQYEGRRSDGTYSNVGDAFNAIRCVDDPRITDRAVVGEADTRYREAAPFLDDGRGTGQAPLDLCAFWPVPTSHATDDAPASGLPDVVVVSTTEDPATPYAAGVDLADRLGGTLVTYEGTQHTVVLSGEECIDDAVVTYFVETTPPPAGLTC